MSQTKAQLIDPVDGTIVNADINASAAIAGSKISPDFGSQNIVTTGGLTVDTTTLHVDNSNNRVGIGLTNPSSPLEVSSASNPVIKATSSSSSVGAAFNAQGGSSNDSQLVLSSGTTAKYTILRDGSQSDDLRIYDSANAIDIIRYRHGSYLHFGLNGSERMRLDSAGRLLHGVTSAVPVCSVANSRLQVHNNASVLTASFTGYGAHSGGSIIALGKSRSSTIGDATGAVQNNDTLGDIRFGGSDGTDMVTTACAIRGEVDGSVSSNTIPGRLEFSTNGTERMRINSSGSVLVGTTSDSIFNDTSGGGFNLKANGQLVLAKEASSSADPLVWLNDTGQTTNKTIVFAQDGSEKANIGLAGNDATITVNGSERARIDSSGTIFSFSTNSITPNIKWRSNDVNWHGSLNQSVGGGTISTILSTGGDWSVDGTTYSATKTLANFETRAIILHPQFNNGAGKVAFLQKAAGSSTTDGTVTEILKIDNDGIKFGSDTASANALNDYEEGTWTPVYFFNSSSTGVTQPSTRNGKYTKIGNRVFFNCHIAGTTGSHSGFFQISGLPFNASSDSGTNYSAFAGWVYAGFDNEYQIIFRSNPNSNVIEVQRAGASVFSNQMTESANYMITGHYKTDA